MRNYEKGYTAVMHATGMAKTAKIDLMSLLGPAITAAFGANAGYDAHGDVGGALGAGAGALGGTAAGMYAGDALGKSLKGLSTEFPTTTLGGGKLPPSGKMRALAALAQILPFAGVVGGFSGGVSAGGQAGHGLQEHLFGEKRGSAAKTAGLGQRAYNATFGLPELLHSSSPGVARRWVQDIRNEADRLGDINHAIDSGSELDRWNLKINLPPEDLEGLKNLLGRAGRKDLEWKEQGVQAFEQGMLDRNQALKDLAVGTAGTGALGLGAAGTYAATRPEQEAFLGVPKTAFWKREEAPPEPVLDPTLLSLLALTGGAAGLGAGIREGQIAGRDIGPLREQQKTLNMRADQARTLGNLPASALDVDDYIAALRRQDQAQHNPALQQLSHKLHALREYVEPDKILRYLDDKQYVIREQAALLERAAINQGLDIPQKIRSAERARTRSRGAGLAAGLGGLGLAAYSSLSGV